MQRQGCSQNEIAIPGAEANVGVSTGQKLHTCQAMRVTLGLGLAVMQVVTGVAAARSSRVVEARAPAETQAWDKHF